MAEYYIGQIFISTYPEDAAEWCNNNNAYIDEIEPENNKRRFQIKEQEPYIPTPEDINKLTMTAWDFVGVLKQAGLNSNQIMMFLNSNPDIQLHLTCCQNVYCGVAKSLMPITYEGITITAEMVEKAFRDKHGV
jgi:hypothetical protein